MLRKRYEIKGMDACRVVMFHYGVQVTVEFKNGNIANNVNASYSTGNRFIQDAIENDERFESGRIILTQVSRIEEEKPKVKVAEVKEAPTTPMTGKTLLNTERGPITVKGGAKKEASKPGQEEEKEAPKTMGVYKKVKEVKNINDAIAYMASEFNEPVQNEDVLAQLMEKHRIQFPNLK